MSRSFHNTMTIALQEYRRKQLPGLPRIRPVANENIGRGFRGDIRLVQIIFDSHPGTPVFGPLLPEHDSGNINPGAAVRLMQNPGLLDVFFTRGDDANGGGSHRIDSGTSE